MELFFDSGLYIAYAFFFGIIIGSFLNVLVYRFHTGKSLGGSSHCLSCNMTLTWYELVPLVSYLALRGRCRNCGSYIPPRYFLVELATGVGFAMIASLGGLLPVQFLGMLLWSILIAILVYDLYHTIIPDAFSLALFLTAAAKMGYEVYIFQDLTLVMWTLLAGAAAAGLFFFLWVVSQGRWIGLGDTKLAFPLGMWVGLEAVTSLVILSFWIGALISVTLIALQQLLARGQLGLHVFGRPLTMKSEVPFAPFLILSFIVTAWFGFDVLSWFMYAI